MSRRLFSLVALLATFVVTALTVSTAWVPPAARAAALSGGVASAVAGGRLVPGSAGTVPGGRLVPRSAGTVPGGRLVPRSAGTGPGGRLVPRSAGAPSGGRLVLPLTLAHAAALDQYVSGLYRRGSADYHRFLTPAQFAARFGASTSQLAAVRRGLSALGFLDIAVAPDRLYVTVPAPLGRRAHLVSGLSGALQGLIGGVITPAQMPTLSAQNTGFRATPTPAAVREPVLRPGLDGGATPCAGASADGGYTAPALASAYNFNALYARGLHGEGMSAAVLEFGGYHDSNITTFENCYGLHIPVNHMRVQGGSGAAANSSEGEVTLDIEVLMEMDPRLARVNVIEAPNTGTGELAAYSAFVNQSRTPVLSVSWGACEQGASQSYEQLLSVVIEQAAAQGQQIFVASGDSGSKGCSPQPLPTGASLSAESEASLPWVTGVGGTDLSMASAEAGATVHREGVWNDGLGAGGGGQSVTWAMPSWQRSLLSATGDHPDGLANVCGAPAGQFCRMVPDIALNADGEEGGADPAYWNVPAGPSPAQFSYLGDSGSPGYSVLCATRNCSAGGSGWGRVGGTSAATPLAAAAALLWDEEATKAGVGLGFLDPSLYALASDPATYRRDFYDVTLGNNNDNFTRLACIAGCSKLYGAGPGYDMATGLGALNVGNLGPDLVRAAGAIALTPSEEQMYGYTRGGPATTAPVSVTRPGAVGETWTATSTAAWLVVGPSGTAPAALSWHVNPRGLSAGTYRGTITVTAADGSVSSLAVTYTVTPPARIGLLTRSLHFFEHAVKPLRAKHIVTCGTPLWGDELEYHGTLPALSGVSFLGDLTAGARRTLRFINRGDAHSLLHFSVDQSHVSWVSNDADPYSNPRGVGLTPGQPLVPSVGSLGRRHGAEIRLASIANSNTVGGLPALQPGTYHGTIIIRDLADPADVARVPVTLTLGNGRGTPQIGSALRTVSVSGAPGQSTRFVLALTDPGGRCGYGYTVQAVAPWLTPAANRVAGTVPPQGLNVPVLVHVPANAAPGERLHTTVLVASVNAANSELAVPVTLRVR